MDQRMLGKVRALLQKAESTEFPQEAEALTARAQELIARYNLDEALLEAEAGGVRPDGRTVAVAHPYAGPKAMLLHVVAEANRCRSVWHRERGEATVLGFPAGRRIDPAQPLQELGLDSLMAVEFRNALSVAVERSLPATLLFSYPALDDIAGFLARDVFAWADEATAEAPNATTTDGQSAPPSDDDLLGSIEDMSDEEVERLFAKQLGGGTSE